MKSAKSILPNVDTNTITQRKRKTSSLYATKNYICIRGVDKFSQDRNIFVKTCQDTRQCCDKYINIIQLGSIS